MSSVRPRQVAPYYEMIIPRETLEPVSHWLDTHLINLNTCRFSNNISSDLLEVVEFPDHAEASGRPDHTTSCGLLELNIVNNVLLKYQFPYDSVNNVVEMIKQHYSLPTNVLVDEDLGHMISVSLKNNRVHTHLDDFYITQGQYHVRINNMFRKARGGDPVMNDEIYNVPEGRTWVCEASHVEHGTTSIDHDDIRYMLSVGFWLSRDELLRVRHKQLKDGDKTWFGQGLEALKNIHKLLE